MHIFSIRIYIYITDSTYFNYIILYTNNIHNRIERRQTAEERNNEKQKILSAYKDDRMERKPEK